MHLKKDNYKMSVTGISIGGGNIQISELDGFSISLSMGTPTFIVVHEDVRGLLAQVSAVISDAGINIGTVTMTRQKKGDNGILVLEVDDKPADDSTKEKLRSLGHVFSVTYFD